MYTRDSILTERGTVSAEAADAWVNTRGKALAPQFGPGGQFVPVPPIGKHYITYCERWGLNADLAIAQFAHETAAGQSAIFRDFLNPAGLGSTNDNPYGNSHRFETVEDGIRAACAHLANYTHGKGEWSQYDPRGLPDAYYGIVSAVKDLEQRWAWSPPAQYAATPAERRYGGMIAILANALLAYASARQEQEQPPVIRVSKPAMNLTYRSGNYDGYGKPRQYLGFCDHIATGSKQSNLNYLSSANGPSVNYYIAKDGELFCIVDPERAAWTNGWENDGRDSRPDLSNPIIRYCYDNRISPNVVVVTIEHEGEPSDTLTAAQIKTNCHLKAWLAQEKGTPLRRDTFLGHYQIDSVNRAYCPSFTEGEWLALLTGAQALLAGGGVVVPPVPPAEDTNALKLEHPDYGTHWIVNQPTEGDGIIRMLDGWKTGGRLAGWGYPLGGMTRHADGVYRQMFENCLIGIWPRGFDGQSAPLTRKEGVPQNWVLIDALVRPIREKWTAAG